MIVICHPRLERGSRASKLNFGCLDSYEAFLTLPGSRVLARDDKIKRHNRQQNWVYVRGFSLLELIIVLGLLACTCFGGLYYATRWYASMAGKLEVLRLRAHCQYAHMQALKTGRMQKLVLNEQGYVINDHVIPFATGVRFGGSYQKGTILGPPSNPKDPVSNFVTFKDATIWFYPNGSASAGLVYLGHAFSPVLYALSSAVSETFFLRVYRYENSSWTLCLS